jgi:hypothetical protein
MECAWIQPPPVFIARRGLWIGLLGLHHLSDGKDLSAPRVDVLHLSTHVLAGDQIGGVGRALTGASCLGSHHNAETLLGGIRSAGLGAGAVDPTGGCTPAAWNHAGSDRVHQGGAAEHGVAGCKALGKAEVAVEANLSTAVFAEDAGEGNRVLPEVFLILL